MAKEMEKVYDPQAVENRLYQKWEDKGYFHAAPNPDKTPFTIVIPPPNITGQLHMGPRPGRDDPGRADPVQAHAGV